MIVWTASGVAIVSNRRKIDQYNLNGHLHKILGGEKMTVSKDERSDERFDCKIPIVVSSFNSRYTKDALLVTHWVDGISFISDEAFFLGAAVMFRIRSFKNSSSSDLERLPSVSIGEVKWCRKFPDEASAEYEVGIKYYPQVY